MNAIRTVFTRLGFSVPAAQSIVDDQQINSLDEIRILRDSEVENLCKVIRCPGGTLPAADPDAPAVPNPGINVSLRAENNLKLAAFCWLRHQVRVSREVTPADITLDSVRSIIELRDAEEGYKASKDDYPTIDAKNWPKTIETIDEFLRGRLGEHHIPLAYVVRDVVELPALPDPSMNYATVQDEMIRRAPHGRLVAGAWVADPIFVTNREKVWDIMAKITRDHACWTYVKPAQRNRDGRAAYKALYDHFLSPNNVDNMAAEAETTLKSTSYNGEQRRWNFEKFVNLHKQQHSILEGLVLHGYAGIDERSKVRHLLDGIKTDKFDSVKTQIMSNAEYRNDFDKCVTLYQDFIRQSDKGKSASTLTIAEFTKVDGKRKRSGTVEDRYYTKEEYSKLDPEQKRELALKRAKRGHAPGSKSSKVVSSGKAGGGSVAKSLKAVTRSVAALAKKVDTIVVTDDSSDASDTVDAKASTPVASGNRTNRALTRSKAKE